MMKTGKRKGAAALPVPVSPGPAGARRGAVPPCVPCGTTGSGTRVPLQLPDGEWIVMCQDGHECAVRYRKGTSPASYAAALRGEILGVAP